jgi:hypothetical protein
MTNRKLRLFPLTCLVLAMLFLSACASDPQAKSLDTTLTQYEQIIRWSQWEGAAGFLSPESMVDKPMTRLDMDRLRLFRVTQYIVRSGVPSDGGLGFRQAVEIRLFNRNQATEKYLIDQQEWRYNTESERWLLHSGLPDVTKAR